MDNHGRRRHLKIAEADGFAEQAHAGQVDKAGAPYIDHCRAVAAAVSSLGVDFEVVGLLHDTLEDTDVTATEIERRFGPEVRAAVEAMTKRPGEDYFEDYLPRALANPIARAVKQADVAHNLGRLANLPPGPDRDRLHTKYERVMAMIVDAET